LDNGFPGRWRRIKALTIRMGEKIRNEEAYELGLFRTVS
jgi:hypothetical protein